MLEGMTEVLSRYPWDFFGTLTFRGAVPPRKVAVSMFHSLVRRAAREWHCRPTHIPWTLREERGERTGRYHLHFLLALPKRGTVLQRLSSEAGRLAAWWQWLGGGEVNKVRPYEKALAGVAYLNKCLELHPGNAYEVSKFGKLLDGLHVASLTWKRLGRAERGRHAAHGGGKSRGGQFLPEATRSKPWGDKLPL